MTINLYGITAFLTFLSSLALAIFVFRINPKNNINRTWSLFTLSVSGWSLFLAFIFISTEKETTLLSAKALSACAVFIPSTYLHFILNLINKSREKTRLIIFTYVFSFLLLFVNFTPLLVKEVRSKITPGFYPTAGPLYIIFIVFFLGCLAYSEYLSIKEYKISKGARRNQLRYVIITTSLGFINGSLLFPLWYDIPFPPVTEHFVFISLVLLAYAIVRHQLLDINIVIKRTLVYSALITLITIIYILAILITERIFRGIFGYATLPMNILAATIIALIFIPLKNQIQYILDKLFFKGTIDTLAKEKEFMRQELIRSDRLKAVATLAAGMVHEIKNPLTAIKTFTEHLKEKKTDPEFIDKFTRIVPSEFEKINGLVHQLLDFSRPKDLQLQQTNIHGLLDDTLELFKQ